MKKQLKNNYNIWKYLVIIVLILIVFNVALVALNFEVVGVSGIVDYGPYFLQVGESTFISMVLPAVDSEGNGVTTLLNVEASPGKGRTLTEIDNLLFWADTQHSIRIARLVANDTSRKDVGLYDLIYSVEADASVVGGPSAGAALAIATIAAIEGKELRNDVMITGAINRDGTLGPVSEVYAKAKASADAGAKILLVPLLQSRDVIYTTEESCEIFGTNEICTTETRPQKINLTEETGIQVIEVGNVGEALKYFY
ncbi:MAG: S16 family serine protease [archaeon]